MKRLPALLAAVVFLLASAPAWAGTVSGTVRYTDRTFDSHGFTGARYLPVPYARIELYRVTGDEVDDVVFLAAAALDLYGRFSFSDEIGPDTPFQLRLYTNSRSFSPAPVKVWTLDGAPYIIVFRGDALVTDSSGDWTGSPGSLSEPATLTVSLDNSGPFNIFFCIAHAARYVAEMEGGAFPPTVTVRWEDGSTTGTYTESVSQNIYLLGDPTRDTDQFDDCVIIHEYGHFITYNYSQDDSPGGYHYGAVTDLRLAWNEAWSGYFSAWMVSKIESWIAGEQRYVSVYVDTRVTGAVSWDIEPPAAAGFPGRYDNDEIAVQSGLWDIYDPPNESWDHAFTFAPTTDAEKAVWTVYRSFRALPSSAVITFETFWEQWFALGFGNRDSMDAVFVDHLGIDLYPDAFENDDAPGTATAVTPGDGSTLHTFSPAGDEDWFSFTVVRGDSYSVATMDLVNGADTVVTVYDAVLSDVLGQNDNEDESTLSSLVTFVAPYSGTVYVKVTQNGTRTYAELGGYKIAVSATSGEPEPEPSEGGGGGGGGCFIATAAFGSMACAAVESLTGWRDAALVSSRTGGGLLRLYYLASPAPALSLKRSPALALLAARLLR